MRDAECNEVSKAVALPPHSKLLFAFLLLATSVSAGDLKLVAERHSLTATWRIYRQVIDGVEVYGTDVIQRVDDDGSVHETHRNVVSRAARRPLSAGDDLVAVNVNGEARPARRVVVEERPMERVALFVDPSTGEVLRREPLFWTAKARVFDPNPVAKLNRPDLQDGNNAASAVPAEAYTEVELDNLPASGALIGPNVSIVDTQQPFTIHADAAQSLLFDRSQPQFEEVNAYFHIDRSQKYLQSLGYSGVRRIVAYSIPVDPHGAQGTDNSFYISNATNGTGALFFGDGGTDDAEDSDIMLHEFGHAIQDWIAPGAFSGESSSQSRAIGEGFGDYWSFSSNYDGTAASGRDPYCIADWDARCATDDSSQNCAYALNADCLRRVDSTKTMTNFLTANVPGTEHQNGEIWSSALREIFLSAGKRTTDTIVLESTFGVPPNTTYAAMAQRMLDADRALYGGAHASAICGAMTKRGILASCISMPRGDLTAIQGAEHGAALPVTSTVFVSDTRTIDRLLVRVDVRTAQRGDLQITLVAPDGTSVILQRSSLDRIPDLHGTFGFDIESAESLDVFKGKSASGTWKLIVTARNGAPGTLVSWDLEIQFAGDKPFAVRPFSFANRLHIPAVAHLDGAGGSQWRSDVFLFNRGNSEANVTLLFTPSGANGATDFGAMRAVIEPKQVVAFRDVVSQLFATTGSGTLEMQGDVQQLVAWSSTDDVSRGLGQTVDAVHSSDSIGSGDAPLHIVPIAINSSRSNIGVIETAGESGTITVTVSGLIPPPLQTTTFTIAPFSHVQFPVTAQNAPGVFPDLAEVKVVAGNARVAAYGSLIRLGSGDPMYVPARRGDAGTFVVPVVADTGGVSGVQWVSEESFVNVGNPFVTQHIAATLYPARGTAPQQVTLNAGGSYVNGLIFTTFKRPDVSAGHVELVIPGGVLYSTRLATFAINSVGDRVDPVPLSQAIGRGDVADAVRIENDAAFRTNAGFAEVAGESAVVRLTLFDSAGTSVASKELAIAPHGWTQIALSAISPAPIVDGRLRFEVLSGDGRIIGYASVVGNASGDAEFVRAR